jgi:hypothetical protein
MLAMSAKLAKGCELAEFMFGCKLFALGGAM